MRRVILTLGQEIGMSENLISIYKVSNVFEEQIVTNILKEAKIEFHIIHCLDSSFKGLLCTKGYLAEIFIQPKNFKKSKTLINEYLKSIKEDKEDRENLIYKIDLCRKEIREFPYITIGIVFFSAFFFILAQLTNKIAAIITFYVASVLFLSLIPIMYNKIKMTTIRKKILEKRLLHYSTDLTNHHTKKEEKKENDEIPENN